MTLYETLRHFADTWGLLGLTLFFLAVLVWVFRRGSREEYARQAAIPFKYDRDEDRHRE